MAYTDEDLEALTPEEREALTESENDNEDQGGGDAGEDQGSDEGADEAGAGDDGAAATGDDDAQGADGGDTGDGGDDAGQAASDDAAQQPAQPAPLLIAEAPADAVAALAAIETKRDALAAQFDEGDISPKEFQVALNALNKEERDIERAVDRANLAKEMRDQQELNAWWEQCKTFTTVAHPEYAASKVRAMALDTFVKEIATENPKMGGAEVLKTAHERVVADLGEAPAKAGSAAKTDPAKTKPLQGSKAKPPVTLSKVPASDATDVEDAEYAALDRLRETDPMKYEDKLMGMSDAKREALLRRA